MSQDFYGKIPFHFPSGLQNLTCGSPPAPLGLIVPRGVSSGSSPGSITALRFLGPAAGIPHFSRSIFSFSTVPPIICLLFPLAIVQARIDKDCSADFLSCPVVRQLAASSLYQKSFQLQSLQVRWET